MPPEGAERLHFCVTKRDCQEINHLISRQPHFYLTSHYVPEELDAVKIKIAYLETMLNIVSACKNKEEMISKVKNKYPNYSGDNYLETTAGFFFPEK